MYLPPRDTLITALAIADIPPSEQIPLLTEVEKNILARVLLVILGRLPEDLQVVFKQYYLEGKHDDAYALASGHVTDLSTHIEKEWRASHEELHSLAQT